MRLVWQIYWRCAIPQCWDHVPSPNPQRGRCYTVHSPRGFKSDRFWGKLWFEVCGSRVLTQIDVFVPGGRRSKPGAGWARRGREQQDHWKTVFSRGHSTSRIIVQRNQSEGSKGTFPSAFGLCRIYAVLSPCCLVYMITCMLLSPCGFVWACAANVAGQEVNQGHRSPVQDGWRLRWLFASRFLDFLSSGARMCLEQPAPHQSWIEWKPIVA